MLLVHFQSLVKIIAHSKYDEQLVVSFLKRKPLGGLTLTGISGVHKNKIMNQENM